MSPEEREASIKRLTEQQAVSITKYMIDRLEDKLPEDSIPEGKEQQVQALSLLLKEYGHDIDTNKLNSSTELNEKDVGLAAKNLLLILSTDKDPEVVSRLDKWLEKPPIEGKASIDSLLTVVPIVLTGCFALLTVTSGIRYEDGKWFYNPMQARELVKDNVSAVADVIKSLFSSVRNT